MLSGIYHSLVVHLPLGFALLAPFIYVWGRPSNARTTSKQLFTVWVKLQLITTTLVFLVGSPSVILISLNESQLEAAPKVLHGLSAGLFWLAAITLWYLNERVGEFRKTGLMLLLFSALVCGYYGGRLVHG